MVKWEVYTKFEHEFLGETRPFDLTRLDDNQVNEWRYQIVQNAVDKGVISKDSGIEYRLVTVKRDA